MKKFTKIIENVESKRQFKVTVQVEFTIEASNEGEASYIADSTISSLKNQSEYTISNIEEISNLDKDKK
jgi:hypothetical protein